MSARTRSWIELTVGAAFAGCVALTLLAASASWWWLGEIACSFRWHLGWACAALALGALVLERVSARGARSPGEATRRGVRRWLALRAIAIASGLLGAWHLFPALTLWWPQHAWPNPPAAPRGREITLASANLFIEATDTRGFVEWVRSAPPDVLGVTEVNSTWRAVCEQLADLYPSRTYFPEDVRIVTEATYGTGLLTRLPVRSTRVHAHENLGGFIEAELELTDANEVEAARAVEGAREAEDAREIGSALDVDRAHGGASRTLHVVMVHPNRPGRGGKWERRDALFAHILDDVRYGERSVLMGDFNTTLYSPLFDRILERTRLRDSRAGRGRQPSFRTKRPIAGLWVDIDHVLVGSAIDVLERATRAVEGSDHLYVETRLSVAAGE